MGIVKFLHKYFNFYRYDNVNTYVSKRVSIGDNSVMGLVFYCGIKGTDMVLNIKISRYIKDPIDKLTRVKLIDKIK